MLSIHHRNILTNSGADGLLHDHDLLPDAQPRAGPPTRSTPAAPRARRGTLAEPLIVPWAQRLIQLQLCLIYFDTAMLKATARPGWTARRCTTS